VWFALRERTGTGLERTPVQGRRQEASDTESKDLARS
jgi:hypothetical protein